MTTAARQPMTTIDWLLLVVFFVGIYLEVQIQITADIPLPCAPAGVAGLALLLRRRNDMSSAQIAALFGVLLLYCLSAFVAPDIDHLAKRFTGLTQFVYSFLIAYAMFMTVTAARRETLSRFFLTFCIVLLVGCALERYAGLRPISDAVRGVLYSRGLYDADLRDQLLYGAIRPKFFASEPSAVTFSLTLFGFAWFMTSRSRYRLPGFLALAGASQIVAPGPTTLLSLVLVGAAYVLLPDDTGRINQARRWGGLLVAALLVLLALQFGADLYSARLARIENNNDPSFFFRVIGPALVGIQVLQHYFFAGIGLTSEDYMGPMILNIFVGSPDFSAAWRPIDNVSQQLNNYFWLHWIYLGAVLGVAAIVAISVFLRTLGVRSLLFCWIAWATLGQASGAYVGPKTWTVLFLVGALSMVRFEQRAPVGWYHWAWPRSPRRHATALQRF
jgi:hypothetical protein